MIRFIIWRHNSRIRLFSGAVVTDRAGVQSRPHAAQARDHGPLPAAVQPHTAIVCRFNRLHPRNHCKYTNMDYNSFADSRGMEG